MIMSLIVLMTSWVRAFTSSVCLKSWCFIFSTSTIKIGCEIPSAGGFRVDTPNLAASAVSFSLSFLAFLIECFRLLFSASLSSGAGSFDFMFISVLKIGNFIFKSKKVMCVI